MADYASKWDRDGRENEIVGREMDTKIVKECIPDKQQAFLYDLHFVSGRKEGEGN